MRASLLFAALASCHTSAAQIQEQQACVIETVAGGGSTVLGDGLPALQADLIDPTDVQAAPDGSLWISDAGQHVIRRIGADGILSTAVGSGRRGFSGDGGLAVEAMLDEPRSLVFAPDGTLYFYDDGNRRIRRVTPDGVITTVVGTGERSLVAEDVPALETGLDGIVELAITPAGELVFSVGRHHRIRRLGFDGRVVTIAGTSTPNRPQGDYSGDGGLAIEAGLDGPSDLAVAPDGAIYVIGSRQQRLRRIDPSGTIDSPLPPRAFLEAEVEIDGEGAIYIETSISVLRLQSDGQLQTVAERPDFLLTSSGPGELAVTKDGQIYVVRNRRVMQVIDGEYHPIAGVGLTMAAGDGGPAAEARLPWIHATLSGPSGELYLASGGRVRVIGLDGVIRPFAGTGEITHSSPDGIAVDARLPGATYLGIDGKANVYVASRNWIGVVDTTGTLTTVIGPSDGTPCEEPDCGDGRPIAEAEISDVRAMAVDRTGAVYLRQWIRPLGRYWIRRIGTDGIIHTLPADPRDTTNLQSAASMTVDKDDSLIVSVRDGSYRRYRPQEGWSRMDFPEGYLPPAPELVAGPQGGLFHSGAVFASKIQLASSDGRVTTIAGSSVPGYSGDGGLATGARLTRVGAMSIGVGSDLYFRDGAFKTIRRISRAAECPQPYAPLITTAGPLNAASYQPGIAPGMIFTVFGRRLGPPQPALAQLSDGRFPTELGGVRVRFDGVPAPLIFTSEGQLSGIVPFAVDGSAAIDLEGAGGRTSPLQLGVRHARPGIFTLDSSGTGQGAILNQDGSLNGPANPAPPGSIVVFFATGAGKMAPPTEDGALARSPLGRPLLDVTASIGNHRDVEVLYTGAAPGLVSGVLQVNVKVPMVQPFPPEDLPIALNVGGWTSPRWQVLVSVGELD